jgi:aconitase B
MGYEMYRSWVESHEQSTVMDVLSGMHHVLCDIVVANCCACGRGRHARRPRGVPGWGGQSGLAAAASAAGRNQAVACNPHQLFSP